MILKTKLLKNEKHQTRVSLLLELVSDAYLTANRTRYMWSSTQETTPLDHASSNKTETRVWCFSFLSSLVSNKSVSLHNFKCSRANFAVWKLLYTMDQVEEIFCTMNYLTMFFDFKPSWKINTDTKSRDCLKVC